MAGVFAIAGSARRVVSGNWDCVICHRNLRHKSSMGGAWISEREVGKCLEVIEGKGSDYLKMLVTGKMGAVGWVRWGEPCTNIVRYSSRGGRRLLMFKAGTPGHAPSDGRLRVSEGVVKNCVNVLRATIRAFPVSRD